MKALPFLGSAPQGRMRLALLFSVKKLILPFREDPFYFPAKRVSGLAGEICSAGRFSDALDLFLQDGKRLGELLFCDGEGRQKADAGLGGEGQDAAL